MLQIPQSKIAMPQETVTNNLTLGNSDRCYAHSKSSSTVRQENLHDFELTPEEMEAITNLDRPDGRVVNQDPAVYEEF